jgi:YHS domain-containing protein
MKGRTNMSKVRKILAGASMALVFGFAAITPGNGAQPQTTCPVLGGPANKRVFADYQGKRIYFCCPPCIRQFKADPEKYMKQMEKSGIVPEDAPKPAGS